MKNAKYDTQEGFSVLAVIAIIAILGIGIGVYNVKHNEAMVRQAQKQVTMQQNANIEANTNINTNIGTTTTTDLPPKDDGGVVADGESGVTGIMYIGPTCGIVMENNPNMCAPKPYAGDIRFTSTSPTSKISIVATANSSGSFRVVLPPGTYTISSSSKNTPPTLSSPTEVTVKPYSYTNIRVDFDSGIR